MTAVAFRYHVTCPPERVRAYMLEEAFLHTFVDEQHPTDKTITVDPERETSTLSWTIRLDGDFPSLVTRFVGRAADLQLVFDLWNSKLDTNREGETDWNPRPRLQDRW